MIFDGTEWRVVEKNGRRIITVKANFNFKNETAPDDRQVIYYRIRRRNAGSLREYLGTQEGLFYADVLSTGGRKHKARAVKHLGMRNASFYFGNSGSPVRRALVRGNIFSPGFRLGIMTDDERVGLDLGKVIDLNALNHFVKTGEIIGESYGKRLGI